MTKTFAKFLFYFVATSLFVWTSYLTYSFVAAVMPNAHFLVPLFSLVVFDIGTIAWLKVFLDQAEGSGQRATAIGLTAVDFLGVGLMTLSEVFLGGQSFAAAPENLGEYAVWGIAIWTIINVGGVIAFHALDPDARRKMAIRAEMDAVTEEAYMQLQSKRRENSAVLAHQISEGMMRQVEHDLLADRNTDGIPDIMQPSVSSGAAMPMPQHASRVAYTAPTISRAGYMDKYVQANALGYIPEPSMPDLPDTETVEPPRPNGVSSAPPRRASNPE